MKKYILKIIIVCIVAILISGKVTFAAAAWEQTDYTTINTENACQYLMDLAAAELENKNDAELWLKKYEQIQTAGANSAYEAENRYFSYVEINYANGKDIINNVNTKKNEAETIIKEDSSGSSNNNNNNNNSNNGTNNNCYQGVKEWTDWSKVPLKEYNTSYYEDADFLYKFLINSPIKTEKMSKTMLQDYIKKIDCLRESPGFKIIDGNQNGKYSQKLDNIYREINGNEEAMEKIAGTDEKSIIQNSAAAQTSAGGVPTKEDTIYASQPKKTGPNSAGGSLDDVINDAQDFINNGNLTYDGELSDVSNIIYNILLSVGVVIAVIVGVIIGIKLMASGIDQKVEAKKLLVPYIAGCIVIFGGFGIWKLVVTILQSI